MNKGELLSFLHEIGANPKKWLSQHFLIDENSIAKCIELADVRAGDRILEIGPGPGAITKRLLTAGAHVVAIEKDPLFAKHLERLQTPDARLQTHTADILDFPLETLGGHWKVVSNLPFHITAPILEILCHAANQFTSLTLIVQKEVAERIKAKPKTKEFGSLTIFLQFYTTCKTTFPIPLTSFYPKPNVDASILHLICHPSLPDIDPQLFFPLVRKAFGQRRKMLTSSLRHLYPYLKSVLEETGLSPKARPEELSFDEWIQLFKYLQKM